MNRFYVFIICVALLCITSYVYSKVNTNGTSVSDRHNYTMTGNKDVFKYSSIQYSITGNDSGQHDMVQKKAKIGTVYNVTGRENKFNLTNFELQNTYDISGNEEVINVSKKLTLSDTQKLQLEYLEMEKKYKIIVVEKEIFTRKKMLQEELSKEDFDVYLIDKLSNEIKHLAVDRETIYINIDKKIRYVLTPDQYINYKLKKNKSKIKVVIQ